LVSAFDDAEADDKETYALGSDAKIPLRDEGQDATLEPDHPSDKGVDQDEQTELTTHHDALQFVRAQPNLTGMAKINSVSKLTRSALQSRRLLMVVGLPRPH